jgi:ribosomal protein S18 acetylase RimI-like enzyme
MSDNIEPGRSGQKWQGEKSGRHTASDVFTVVTTERQREIVESLAREIWTEHYSPIIGREQVDYMLDKFQSQEAIAEQIRAGVIYFLIRSGEEFIGYIAVQPKGDELFLSKIYVASKRRGRGHGKKAIQFVESLAKERKLGKIVLTVNKNNSKSIRAYEKMGFTIAGALTQDIGNGFVMDDYKMEKIV